MSYCLQHYISAIYNVVLGWEFNYFKLKMFRYIKYNVIFHLFSIALEEVAEVVDDLLVAHVLEGLFASKRQDLPQSDRESPYVAFAAEFALKKWWHYINIQKV